MAQKFKEKGYVICRVANQRGFEQIQELIAEVAADFLGSTFEDPEKFLNQIHQQVDTVNLNALRLHVIREMNTRLGSGKLFSTFKLALEMLVGNELMMQLRII